VLRWRLISAAVILAVLLALIWLDARLVGFGTPGAWLLPVMIAVSLLATEELSSFVRAQGHRPLAWTAYAGNFLIPLTAAWPVLMNLAGHPAWFRLNWHESVLFSVAISAILVLVGEMARFQRPGTAVVNAALSVFALIYIGLLMSFWAMLRLHGGNGQGVIALVSMLLIVKMADTGAFAFGKMLGRHKMTPILSPGKTWEGTLGGIVTACAVSWLFFHFGAPRIDSYAYVEPPLVAVLAYGVALALAGIAGDLAESMLKRDVGQKDSSTWLRGLGGVLDIIDAPLVAGPVAWLFWKSGWLGG
jgi:phosphatidate cytidylyltransferase